MADMKRTTGGLMQGMQRTVTRGDLRSAVGFLDARVKDAAVRQVLRLDVAKKHANVRNRIVLPDSGYVVGDIQDLQRAPKKR